MQMFQSTLPARGSDPVMRIRSGVQSSFQSTLPARGSDMIVEGRKTQTRRVSIHAPREGERQSVTIAR